MPEEEYLSIVSKDAYHDIGGRICKLAARVASVQETEAEVLGFTDEYFDQFYELLALIGFAASQERINVRIDQLAARRFAGHKFKNELIGFFTLNFIMEDCAVKRMFRLVIDKAGEILNPPDEVQCV